MLNIKIRIDGKTPLLMNAFTVEAQDAATGGTSAAQTGDRGTPLEIATKKLYTDHEGTIIIPQPNIFKSIMEGGSFFKVGKRQVTTQKTSLIPSCVDMNEVYYDLIYKQPWTVDTRPVRIPATGGRILCHRPMFDDWALEFEVELDTTIVGIKLFRDIVDRAGKGIGLGDFRPACKGPFGKYLVSHWQAVELPVPIDQAA